MKTYIRIDGPNLQEDRTLVFRISCSQNIRKYLMSPKLWVEYDESVDSVPKSILMIPAISGVVHLAWHIGADVYVGELDETYLNSLGKIKTVMNKWHPNLPFSEIYVDEIIPNKFSGEGCGMLFSGGIDSMTTYIRHRGKKPNLIHLITREKYLKTNKEHLINFANQQNVKINIIKTNVDDIIHTRLLTAQFGIEWGGGISHGTVYTGLAAPLTIRNRIGTLLMASSHTRDFKQPWGSHPLIDNNISWGGAKVMHDGYEISRQEKIRFLKSYIIENRDGEEILDALALVLVPDHCRGSDLINQSDNVCGKCDYCLRNECEKCLRDITGLALEGIDPNNCGFSADNETFDFIKRSLIEGKLVKRKLLIQTRGESISLESDLFFWKDIQRQIPKMLDYNLYNSKEFFHWLRDFDITGYKAKVGIFQLPRLLVATIGFKLYPVWCSLPMSAQNASLLKKLIDFAYKKVH